MKSLLSGILFAGCALLLGGVTVYAQTGASECSFIGNRNLQIGSNGVDVFALQQFLNTDPTTALATTGVGSSGNESRAYGMYTKQAVAKFQEKYASDILSPIGLTKGTGVVGSLTRAKLHTLCTASVSTALFPIPTESPTDSLTISSPAQPKHLLAPAGAGGVPFTSITLTAGRKDVTVDSITVERTGPGVDAVFESITLTDENGESIGDDKSFNSNHRALFKETFTIPAHTSKTLTILGNMTDDLTDYAGQTPIIQINAIDASSSIVGTLPVKGTSKTMNNTLVIGGAMATLSQYDPNTSSNRYINDTGIRFSGIRITANSQEDLSLSSITWDQGGTAGDSDIAEIVTVVSGIPYPTEIDNRSYTSSFSPAILIRKGESVDLYVQGNLTTTGANRTVVFDIDSSDDISLTGNTYRYGVGVVADGNTATSGTSVFITSDGTSEGDEGTPFFAGSVATINGGTVTSIGKN